MSNKTSTAAGSSNAARKEWPQRFGKLVSLSVKSGRNGSYGIITLDCGGKFEQTAFIFKAEILAKAEAAAEKANAAGVTADIWFKGPIEAVARNGVTRDQMKVVYLKDNTDYGSDEPQPEADEQSDETAQATDETASDATGATLEDEVPF